jgi:hypothetical protein
MSPVADASNIAQLSELGEEMKLLNVSLASVIFCLSAHADTCYWTECKVLENDRFDCNAYQPYDATKIKKSVKEFSANGRLVMIECNRKENSRPVALNAWVPKCLGDK